MNTAKTNKTNKRDKQWMRNPDQLKTPKLFNVTMVRNTDGSFHLLGGQSQYLKRINQYSSEWVNVDTRDLTCELRRSLIKSL